ncbi:hypothetical protein BMETH_1848_1 [methanotrophic bacterial endosymbiont of Bathymodiolus sp.]|nr:hypothetical protein BMETH_1848_1 [methanotrophic bacterial endosymbiont of Bathymodiolus sp.]
MVCQDGSARLELSMICWLRLLVLALCTIVLLSQSL